MNTSFLVVESLAWTEEQANADTGGFQQKLNAGWQYRHQQQEAGKIKWYQSIEPNARGVVVVSGSLDDLQAYFNEDPLGQDNMVKREVIPLVSASISNGNLNTEVTSKDSLSEAAGIEIDQGSPSDFTFSLLEPDLGSIMSNCGTNNGGGY